MRFVPMDNRNLNFLYGYALSREAGKLVDAYNPKKLIRTVFKFAAKRLAFYTDDQLSAAVDYCLFGADWTACERVKSEELRVKSEEDSTTLNSQLSTHNSPTIGLLTKARALRLPEYYGGNLDALWDELCAIRADLVLESPAPMLNALGPYGCKLLQTLYEAAGENPDFQFRIAQ